MSERNGETQTKRKGAIMKLARLVGCWVGLVILAMVTVSFQKTEAYGLGNEGQIVSVTAADDGRRITLGGGTVLVIELESNPTTGYSWDVVHVDSGVLLLLSEEWTHQSDLLGAPGTQRVRLIGLKKGETPLTLAYRRPWERERPPLKTVSYTVDVTEDPTDAIERLRAVEQRTEAGEEEEGLDEAGLESLQALPTAFNWCDQGICPPVRDQGACGSCWAFGTVAPFESGLKLKTGQMKDISEQYLLSCNIDGFSCDGGWFAHDYHIDKIPPGENAAGAVYESEFPYVASDVPCGSPHPHHEKLSSWSYVGSQTSVPSADAIKQAIYNHGPVAAAVCVNRPFQRYSGGIFSSRWPCRKINHAIVLVGWDDAQGAWILRNSWGSAWGEQGYMRIKYGQNQVGYGANFVVLP